mgnify:CR=1 FL=1
MCSSDLNYLTVLTAQTQQLVQDRLDVDLQARAFELIGQADAVPAAARIEIVATLACSAGWQGMVGGQFLDITAADVDLAELHRLKTGRLFAASVGLGLWAAGLAEPEHAPWRAFGEGTARSAPCAIFAALRNASLACGGSHR